MKTLRVLLDQMLDEDVAGALLAEGHDAVRVSELGLATADDEVILKHAIRENRILLTLDEHFGDWAVLPLWKHPGVIRLKIEPTTTSNVLGLLLPFLETHADRDFANQLVILKRGGVRWLRTDRGFA